MTTDHEGQRIEVSSLIVDGQAPVITGHRFTRCEIVGPAVLIPVDQNTFSNNTMQAEMFWTIDATRLYVGGIGITDCVFEQCTFIGIGIAGPLELIQSFFDQ